MPSFDTNRIFPHPITPRSDTGLVFTTPPSTAYRSLYLHQRSARQYKRHARSLRVAASQEDVEVDVAIIGAGETAIKTFEAAPYLTGCEY